MWLRVWWKTRLWIHVEPASARNDHWYSHDGLGGAQVRVHGQYIAANKRSEADLDLLNAATQSLAQESKVSQKVRKCPRSLPRSSLSYCTTNPRNTPKKYIPRNERDDIVHCAPMGWYSVAEDQERKYKVVEVRLRRCQSVPVVVAITSSVQSSYLLVHRSLLITSRSWSLWPQTTGDSWEKLVILRLSRDIHLFRKLLQLVFRLLPILSANSCKPVSKASWAPWNSACSCSSTNENSTSCYGRQKLRINHCLQTNRSGKTQNRPSFSSNSPDLWLP